MTDNLTIVQNTLSAGGSITPLLIPKELTHGTGLLNPSLLYVDDTILVNIRQVNYSLYHSEYEQKFPSRWGPLSYLHPETDQTLTTTNFLCTIDPESLLVDKFCRVNTSALDVPPIWEFIGLEDARLAYWDDKLYMCGVRRDTTPHGQGRMELSELHIDKETWTVSEVARTRMPTTGDDSSYCEKNWMPITDMPYHFVKWTNPTEVVKYDVEKKTTEQVHLSHYLPSTPDFRGGSQVVRWNNFYIAFTHEVEMLSSYLGQKDAIYRHRLVVWDDKFDLIGLSPKALEFLGARIEFCAGVLPLNGDLLVSFGFQDNAAYLLNIPGRVVDEYVQDALDSMMSARLMGMISDNRL
jgi:predicted GH43/DUF377 family glycosyl hydrolase